MNTRIRRFSVGFVVGALAAVFLNMIPYLRTRGAYNGDGFEIIGVPFIFRRLGGIAGIYEFDMMALLGDIAVGLVIAVFVACAFSRASKAPEIGKRQVY